MAESLLRVAETKTLLDGYSDSVPDSSKGSSLFQRRIEFHPARKPFRGFSNGDGDFRLETLNPCSSDPCRPGSNQGQSPLGGKKADGSEVMENGLDPELSFGITFRRIVSFFCVAIGSLNSFEVLFKFVICCSLIWSCKVLSFVL